VCRAGVGALIYARKLGSTLRHLLEVDPRVVILGEDILDPYGGAFKVTRGLSADFPTRVRGTPVSEAAIAGVSAGLALAGFRPISEIMFGDFLALCFDQIVNHVAKYRAMYDGGATCPVIIRSATGGGRGYGPTHSQSLEKHFVGIPHLRVVAGSLWHNPLALFESFLADASPVLHIEHKLLYPLPMRAGEDSLRPAAVADSGSDGFPPTVSICLVPREECSLTVVAYGYQAELAERVLDRLAVEEELFAELLIPAQLSPVDWAPLERSVAVTGSLLTVEEGTGGWSWGTEVAAELGSRLFGRLRRAPRVLASARDVIPSAPDRETEMLVGEQQIEGAVRTAAA
jgi:acetoin:2,6-dichlorophenolindophenol oxidoreductase subunit beta